MSFWNLTRSRGEFMWVQLVIAIIALAYAVFAGLNMSWLWVTLAIYAVFHVVLIEAYLHRYCTHRSYNLPPITEKLLAFFSAVVPGTGSPAGWTALHTAHHQYTDTEKDPHSAAYTSFWKLVTFQYPYAGTLHSSGMMMRQKHHKILHKYYLLFMAAWAAVITALLGVPGLIFVVLIPWGLGPLFSTVQNYFLHYDMPGNYRNHETNELSQNAWLLHLLSFGSTGLHNNHHANARAWNTAEKWWEFDTSAWFIRLVRSS